MAFLFTFGVKPSKDDLEVASLFLEQTTGCSDFILNEEQFVQLIQAFESQMPNLSVSNKNLLKTQAQIEQAWELMGGKEKGFITVGEYHALVKECLPACFDPSLMVELFREVDSNKDGRLSFKDFSDCLQFTI